MCRKNRKWQLHCKALGNKCEYHGSSETVCSFHSRIFHSYGQTLPLPVKGCFLTYARHLLFMKMSYFLRCNSVNVYAFYFLDILSLKNQSGQFSTRKKSKIDYLFIFMKLYLIFFIPPFFERLIIICLSSTVLLYYNGKVWSLQKPETKIKVISFWQ